MNRQNRNPEKADRHSGMEALRMLAGMAVIVLHFNYLPGGRGAMEGASGTAHPGVSLPTADLIISTACGSNVRQREDVLWRP